MSAQTTTGAAGPEAVPPTLTYFQLFMRFLKFGFLAWGGPVAQVAMLRRELVNEERWISSERFNRLLAVMQVLPGPEAHELCVHLGMRAKGRLGGVLAGLAFMLPGFLLMLALSWLYFRMDIAGTALGAAFLGVQAAVIALIVRAVHRIGEHILVDRWLWAIAIVAALASAAGVAFWITLPAAGGAEPNLIGQFGTWGAYTAMPNGKKVCVAGSPSWSLPARWRWPPRWRSGRRAHSRWWRRSSRARLRCCSSSSPG